MNTLSTPKITNRLFINGPDMVKSLKRPADSRSLSQLKETIEAYCREIPEIQQFAKDINKLPKRDMGVVADILELSEYDAPYYDDIDLKDEVNGEPALKIIVNEVIKASKNNPEALTLINSIINNIGAKPIKFFLMKMTDGTLLNKDRAKQMKETAKVIPEIAYESFIGLDFDNMEEKNFVSWIKTFTNPETKPDKITSLFNDIIGFAKTREENIFIDAVPYLHSDTSKETIRNNLKILNEIMNINKGQMNNVDLVSFVIKNKNIA